ncbi:MAG: MBL fold metallo-hydrolase [Ignavibacteria bacterium]|nr:MBL fold metallo-hydrolase [Ignavibacteria bacterium]
MTRRRLLSSLILVAGSHLLPPAAFPTVATSAPGIRIPDSLYNGTASFWSYWIGHSTILMRFENTWVLTDPVMFDAYGLSVFGTILGPQRLHRPAISIDDLPRPHLILLSHAHLDHMDRTTLAALSELYPKQIDVVTASNTADVIRDLNWSSINELDWGNKVSMHGLDIEGVRVKHNGWRWPGEPCRAAGQRTTGRSYNGYYIESHSAGVMFGGDTAHTSEFKRYKGKVDVAFMPIGAYGGYHDAHCTPEEALDMTRMMHARHLVPIYHATFHQGSEPTKEPITRLEAALCKNLEPILAARHVGDTLSLA